ncbi:MAG: hypothetical protein Q8R39_00430 [bacterium]|nr:hypothetical protein [bacterium]
MRLPFVPFLLLFCLLPVAAVAAPPSVAVKFFIVNPDDSTAGVPVTVTVEARKQNNQVDTGYQSDVTLVAGGSATGGGVVDIVNGVGTRQINDLVAETVTLSLSDTETTGLDVSSTQTTIFSTGSGGGGGGGTPSWNQQKFWFRDDDGSEITDTGYGAENVSQNTNITNVPQGTPFRLRFAIKLGTADGTISPRVEFKEGIDCTTGSWAIITPASASFNLMASTNFDDSAPTTQQLVGGLNFVAGKILESTNPASAQSMLKGQSTEYEWSLKAADDVPLGRTYSFRVTNDAATLDAYEACPTLTIQPPPSQPISGGVTPTTISFSGKAFPGAQVFVVDKDSHRETIVSQDVITNDDGSFNTSFVGVLKSQHSFGLLIKDKEGRTTQTKFFNVNTLADDLVEKDIVVPPTVAFVRSVVTRGDEATITGFASPRSSVVVEMDGTIKKEVRVADDGSYTVAAPTSMLEFGSHRVRVKQLLSRGEKEEEKESDFSPTKNLVVSRLAVPKTDFSGDGRVDIKDWSIFLSRWASKDAGSRRLIDLNEDGAIDISDFSIFVRNIRKR